MRTKVLVSFNMLLCVLGSDVSSCPFRSFTGCRMKTRSWREFVRSKKRRWRNWAANSASMYDLNVNSICEPSNHVILSLIHTFFFFRSKLKIEDIKEANKALQVCIETLFEIKQIKKYLEHVFVDMYHDIYQSNLKASHCFFKENY